jgi:hypothetical protein
MSPASESQYPKHMYFYGGTGIWTQSFALEQQAIDRLSHVSSLHVHFSMEIFDAGSCAFCPWDGMKLKIASHLLQSLYPCG